MVKEKKVKVPSWSQFWITTAKKVYIKAITEIRYIIHECTLKYTPFIKCPYRSDIINIGKKFQ